NGTVRLVRRPLLLIGPADLSQQAEPNTLIEEVSRGLWSLAKGVFRILESESIWEFCIGGFTLLVEEKLWAAEHAIAHGIAIFVADSTQIDKRELASDACKSAEHHCDLLVVFPVHDGESAGIAGGIHSQPYIGAVD